MTTETQTPKPDLDDLVTLRRVLTDLVTQLDDYSRVERINIASRIAFYAGRIAWLESSNEAIEQRFGILPDQLNR